MTFSCLCQPVGQGENLVVFLTGNLPCRPEPVSCPAYEGFVFCHSDPTPCPAREVDSPVEAGEVADEVRQKGGAPAEGVSKNIGYGCPAEGVSKTISNEKKSQEIHFSLWQISFQFKHLSKRLSVPEHGKPFCVYFN